MLYVIDFILLVGCILVLSAGIVWAFRSGDYSKNPLHRLYQLLSAAYLRISDFTVAGWDALRNGKEEICERLFGNLGIFSASEGGIFEVSGRVLKEDCRGQSRIVRSRQYRRKILK